MTQAEREHVGLELRPADGLLGRDVADRAGARRLQRALRDLREAEVRELELIVREQDEVVGLDVAVDDVGAMRVRHGRERLLDELQRRLRREPPPHAAR